MLNGQDDVISAASKAANAAPGECGVSGVRPGWAIDRANGLAYHSGLTPGLETLAILSPEHRRGAVVLVNANGGIGFGENAQLFNGVSARAFGLNEDGGGAGIWSRRFLFLTFALLPVLFVCGIAAAWFRRRGLRAKSGAFGAFSLWFPLLASLAVAWTALYLIPRLFGVSLETFSRYQPDFVVLLIATAATGLLWALFRLGVFYSGRPASGGAPAA
ncbi:MAG: hypothetical protein R3C16_07835 [Hyphomonadaceae bacterium]